MTNKNTFYHKYKDSIWPDIILFSVTRLRTKFVMKPVHGYRLAPKKSKIDYRCIMTYKIEIKSVQCCTASLSTFGRTRRICIVSRRVSLM